jgi:hypothetical protein
MTPFATGGRYVIRMVEAVGIARDGSREAGTAGTWLASYDPEFAAGQGFVETTRSLERAARFPSQQAAYACYRYVPRARRTRPDGKLNRPLTAWTVMVEPAPDPRAN